MAFEYKSTSVSAQVASPNIQVAVNDSASKAFKSLSDVMTGAAKVASSAMDAKTQTLQKQTKTAVITEMGAARSNYIQKSSQAGLNSAAQQALAQDYLTKTDTMFSMLDSDAQAQLASFYNDNRNSVVKNYTTQLNKAQKHDFNVNFSETLPAILSQDENLRGATLAAYAADAQRFGIEPNDFAKSMIEQTINHRIAAIPDSRQMVNDRDYTYVANMEKDLEFFARLDKNLKGKDYFDKAKGEVDKIRKTIDKQLVGELKQSIERSDLVSFEGLLTEATLHKAISTNEARLYLLEFEDKLADSTKNAQKIAQAHVTAANGLIVLSDEPDKKIRNAKATIVNARVTEMLKRGNYNYAEAKHHAGRNPEEYGKVYKAVFNSALGNILSIARDPVKDEAGKIAQAGQLTDALMRVRELSQFSFGTLDSNALLKMDTMEMLVASNMGQNMPEVLRILDNQGGVELIAKGTKYVDKIFEDLPQDARPTAHRQFSALVAAGIGEEQAYDLVENQHTYDVIGDQSFEISTFASEELISKGFTQDSLKHFEENLMDSLPAEIMFSVQDVINGSDPKMTLMAGSVFFKNAEGDTATVLLYPEHMKQLVDASNKQWQDENVQKGVEVMANDAASAMSKSFSSFWDTIKAEGIMYNEAVEAGTAPIINQPKALLKFMATQPEAINNFIENVYSKDKTWGDAFNEYVNESSKHANDIMDAMSISNEKERKEFREAVKGWKKESQEVGKNTGYDPQETARWLQDNNISTFLGKYIFGRQNGESKLIKRESDLNQHLETVEGTKPHVGSDSQNITMPNGIVPDEVQVGNKVVKKGENTLTDEVVKQGIKPETAVKTVAGEKIEAKNFDNPQEFTLAVTQKYYDTTAKLLPQLKDPKAIEAMTSFVMNTSSDGKTLKWSGARETIAELAKPASDRNLSKLWGIVKHSYTDGKPSIGLMKRRVIDLNLALPENQQGTFVSMTKDPETGKAMFGVFDEQKNLLWGNLGTKTYPYSKNTRTWNVKTDREVQGIEF